MVVAGYANEYVSYLTTPEEYEAQHYEGGTTVYGPASGTFVASALGDLAGRLARGAAAPRAVPVRSHTRPATGRPGLSARGARPAGSSASRAPRGAWAGRRSPGAAAPTASTARSTGPSCRSSADTAGSWHTVDDDRGLRILWRIDDDRPQELGIPVLDAGRRGTYRAWWEAPWHAAAGRYRFVVTRHAATGSSRGPSRHASRTRCGSVARRARPGVARRSRCATRPRCPSAISRPARAAPGAG